MTRRGFFARIVGGIAAIAAARFTPWQTWSDVWREALATAPAPWLPLAVGDLIAVDNEVARITAIDWPNKTVTIGHGRTERMPKVNPDRRYQVVTINPLLHYLPQAPGAWPGRWGKWRRL